MTPLPRPVGEALGGKRRGLGQGRQSHAAPLPRPRPGRLQPPLAGQPEAAPAGGGPAAPRVQGHDSSAHNSSVLPPAAPALRERKWRRPRTRHRSRRTHLRLAKADPVAAATAANMTHPSRLPPPAAAHRKQRAKARMRARTGAAAAAWGKAARVPGG